MAAFEYQALDASGRRERGVLQADTARAARQLLRDRGLVPLEVHAVAERPATAGHDGSMSGSGFGDAELALVTRQFATLIGAGLALDDALAALGEQSETERARRIWAGVRAKMREGAGLAQSLATFPRCFDRLYCAAIAAGEHSGRLDEVLLRLAEYLELRAGFREKLGLALIYPALLAGVAVLVVTGLLAYVVPQVVEVYAHGRQSLPWLTRALIALSAFIQHHGGALLLAAVLAAAALVGSMRWEATRLAVDRLLLRLPLLGRLLRDIESARLARTLAIAIAAAVPVLEALRLAGQVLHRLPLRRALASATLRVREGASVSAALGETRQFPALLLRLIASGERSGRLGAMVEHAAALLERSVQARLARILALLEPLAILIMGAVVLAIVLAILLPIFQMNQLLGR